MTCPAVRSCLLPVALLAFAGLPATAGAEVLLGDPSVQSQRGQRLKLVLPYGSAPGEPVSVSRFEVVSVTAPPGYETPRADAFLIAKPARRNLVVLRSDERVDAPELTVVVRVAGQEHSVHTWRVAVPPTVFAAAAPAAPAAAAAPARPPAPRPRLTRP